MLKKIDVRWYLDLCDLTYAGFQISDPVREQPDPDPQPWGARDLKITL